MQVNSSSNNNNNNNNNNIAKKSADMNIGRSLWSTYFAKFVGLHEIAGTRFLEPITTIGNAATAKNDEMSVCVCS
jgi:hypothetical protein